MSNVRATAGQGWHTARTSVPTQARVPPAARTTGRPAPAHLHRRPVLSTAHSTAAIQQTMERNEKRMSGPQDSMGKTWTLRSCFWKQLPASGPGVVPWSKSLFPHPQKR